MLGFRKAPFDSLWSLPSINSGRARQARFRFAQQRAEGKRRNDFNLIPAPACAGVTILGGHKHFVLYIWVGWEFVFDMVRAGTYNWT